MIYLVLLVFGLCAGSFVNALVYRIYEQDRSHKNRSNVNLSILKGRSICPQCKHKLSYVELVPVLSWLTLRGKCRHCAKPISWQYPIVELLTAVIFVISYAYWPIAWDIAGIVNFIVWLIVATAFIALLVYDLRWMLLPNRIVYPVLVLVSALAIYNILSIGEPEVLYRTLLSTAIGGGIFYLLFVVSNGKWIGGGDVKLGLLIGILLQDPYHAFLLLFLASILGTLFVLPSLLLKRVTTSTRIPFGPFLIIAAFVIRLFGADIIRWYESVLFVSI